MTIQNIPLNKINKKLSVKFLSQNLENAAIKNNEIHKVSPRDMQINPVPYILFSLNRHKERNVYNNLTI